jgi:hypothetical protein
MRVKESREFMLERAGTLWQSLWQSLWQRLRSSQRLGALRYAWEGGSEKGSWYCENNDVRAR